MFALICSVFVFYLVSRRGKLKFVFGILLMALAFNFIQEKFNKQIELIVYKGKPQYYGEREFDWTLTGRVEIWKKGLEILKQRPYFGYGLNGQYQHYIGRGMHNGFINALVETGILGVLALSTAILFGIIGIWQKGKQRGFYRSNAAMIGFTVMYLVRSMGERQLFNFGNLVSLTFILVIVWGLYPYTPEYNNTKRLWPAKQIS